MHPRSVGRVVRKRFAQPGLARPCLASQTSTANLLAECFHVSTAPEAYLETVNSQQAPPLRWFIPRPAQKTSGPHCPRGTPGDWSFEFTTDAILAQFLYATVRRVCAPQTTKNSKILSTPALCGSPTLMVPDASACGPALGWRAAVFGAAARVKKA